ncbi:MAG: hypothetical protein ABIR70_02335 [Bryobacteraceae bacterium]
MMIRQEDQVAYEALEGRLKTMLPEQYQECYDDVQPVSMGSAGLKYGEDGKVAWDEIWGSFCDLAMAGGPPHKGSLLLPGSRAEIEAQPERYREVVEEICRGITMVTQIPAEASADPGWVRMDCESYGMAGWLVRAIVMENVSVRCEGTFIELPAGPSYRIEKEIKNVITVIAKTCHYWLDHMWAGQQRDVGNLFAVMAAEFPLVQPAAVADDALRERIAAEIEQATGLRASDRLAEGWLDLECPDVRAAIWMMRALVVSNILARREGTVLFVPVNAAVVAGVVRVHGFAAARGVL